MPSRVVAGIGLSHVPSVGVAYDRGKMQTPAWKPLADAYVPVRKWLGGIGPDVAIVVSNDHGPDFMFDKYPTFAIGAAERYGIADEGFGTRALPEVRHSELMRKAGVEAVELIMWHVMRGALSPNARRVHRHDYAPMTTGMGLITFPMTIQPLGTP